MLKVEATSMMMRYYVSIKIIRTKAIINRSGLERFITATTHVGQVNLLDDLYVSIEWFFQDNDNIRIVNINSKLIILVIC